MPVRKSKGVHRNDFDVSVDEGTFGDYEVFGVNGGHGKDRSSEYEIFIVQTPNHGFRSVVRIRGGMPASGYREEPSRPVGPLYKMYDAGDIEALRTRLDSILHQDLDSVLLEDAVPLCDALGIEAEPGLYESLYLHHPDSFYLELVRRHSSDRRAEVLKAMDADPGFENLKEPHTAYNARMRTEYEAKGRFWGLYDGTWTDEGDRDPWGYRLRRAALSVLLHAVPWTSSDSARGSATRCSRRASASFSAG